MVGIAGIGSARGGLLIRQARLPQRLATAPAFVIECPPGAPMYALQHGFFGFYFNLLRRLAEGSG